jgi:hypothetical protein
MTNDMSLKSFVSFRVICQHWDDLIMDICARGLHDVISNKLKIKYLSDSNHEHNSDVKGVSYGESCLLVCSLTVKIKEKIKKDKFCTFYCRYGFKNDILSRDDLMTSAECALKKLLPIKCCRCCIC